MDHVESLSIYLYVQCVSRDVKQKGREGEHEFGCVSGRMSGVNKGAARKGVTLLVSQEVRQCVVQLQRKDEMSYERNKEENHLKTAVQDKKITFCPVRGMHVCVCVCVCVYGFLVWAITIWGMSAWYIGK